VNKCVNQTLVPISSTGFPFLTDHILEENNSNYLKKEHISGISML